MNTAFILPNSWKSVRFQKRSWLQLVNGDSRKFVGLRLGRLQSLREGSSQRTVCQINETTDTHRSVLENWLSNTWTCITWHSAHSTPDLLRLSLVWDRDICWRRVYTVSQKHVIHYIFDDNLNMNCPITIILVHITYRPAIERWFHFVHLTYVTPLQLPWKSQNK